MDGAGSSQGPEHVTDAPRSFEYIDYATLQREVFDPTILTTRLCLCHHTHTYPNLVVNQVVKERDDLLRDYVTDRMAAEEKIGYLDGCLNLAYDTIEQVQEEARQVHELARWAQEEMHRAQEELGRVHDDHDRVIHRLGVTERKLLEIGAMEELQESQFSVNQEEAGGYRLDDWVSSAAVGEEDPAAVGEEDPVAGEEDPEEEPTPDPSRTPSGPL